MTDRDFANLDAARAALADPQLSLLELTSLCFAQPGLRAEAALHPAADRSLLSWLAAQDDPVAAAAASVRLAELPTAVPAAPAAAPNPAPGPAPAMPAAVPSSPAWSAQPAPTKPAAAAPSPAWSTQQPPTKPAAASPSPAWSVQPAPAAAKPGGAKLPAWALIGGGALLAVGAAVAAWTLVIPLFWGGSGSPASYAPEFRELPGLSVVSAVEALPAGQEWSTGFYPVGSELMVGWNSTSAVYEYQSQLEEYENATRARQEWDAAYAQGHLDGKRCLTRTDVDLTWYSSIASYCDSNISDNLSNSSAGGWAGYGDAVAGLPADPARSSEAPQVPAKPVPPGIGENLVAVNLSSASLAWSWNPADLWPGVSPSVRSFLVGDDAIAVLLSDPTRVDDSDPTLMLATIDAKSGAVKSSLETRQRDTTAIEWLVGDAVVVVDDRQQLRALDVSDLTREKWKSSAVPLEPNGWSYPDVLPGGYLPTDNGYLRASDGERAPFAIDAGRRGVLLQVIPGSDGQLVRLEGDAERETLRLAGFDTGNNAETWVLDRLSIQAQFRAAGKLLLVVDQGSLEAYQAKGDQLETSWRYRCTANCYLAFADHERVFVMDDDELLVLSAQDKGKPLGSVRIGDSSQLLVAKSTMYVVDQHERGAELTAYDLSKSGFPALWRSPGFSGWVRSTDKYLVIEDGLRNQLGILGGDREDWAAVEPTDGP